MPASRGHFLFRITIARMKPFASVLVPLVLAAASLSAAAQDQPQTQLPRVTLTAGMHRIDAQVAENFDERMTGLMFRKEMPQNEGMLFVFEQASVQCFWMKNTLLPLTAAFVADDGTIVNLADMKPQTTDSHCSTKPVRFVLEMNQGWFGKKGIKPGMKLAGSPFKG
jgi:uncharacterized membrane protein (UPF0127 family)